MANTLMSLLVSIGADTTDLKDGLNDAQKMAASFGSKMENVGKSITKIGGAMTLGLTLPIASFGASAVKSAMDSESAMAELNAVIESTGGAAGVSADMISKMSHELQGVTKFSDEAIMNGQSMLLTFTQIGKDTFPAATEAMLNMAEKFGSIDQAAVQLGKALNDPIGGVTALRRVGVMLSDAQEKQIKDFMAVNDIASAQAVILGELQTEFGGLAKAAGETTAGKMEQFKNQLDDMKETIGAALIPVLLRFMNAVTPLIEKFASASPEMQNFVLVLAGVLAVAGPVISIIGGIVTGIGAIIPVITAVAAAVAPFILPLLAIIAVLALLYAAWVNNWGGIQEKFAAFIAWITPAWNAVWNGLISVFQFVWAQIKTLWEAFSALFQGDFFTFGEKLREFWDRAWTAIKTVASGAWEFLKTAFANLVKSIVNFFVTTNWMQVGIDIIKGIAKGILSAIPNIISAAGSVINAVKQAAMGFSGTPRPVAGMATHSPITVRPDNQQRTPLPPSMTINITNPKKETAEESIIKTLKTVSHQGYMPR